MCNVRDRENAAAGRMEIKMQDVSVRYKHTHIHREKHSSTCVCVPSRISFARERDEAEKIKRIKYKNGNNNKAETETEAGQQKHNGASRCPLAARTGETDETERTYDPTLTPLQRQPLAQFPLSPAAHTHFYMGAARTPM